MSSINVVTLSGRVSRRPRRVRAPDGDGYVYAFPLAVRQGQEIVFPMVIAPALPRFVTYHAGCKLHQQPSVTVAGRARTRNLTRPLAEDLAAQARRAGAPQAAIEAIREQLGDLDLKARRVVTEVLADTILEGGAW